MPKSPIDRLFDEILFPRLEELFDKAFDNRMPRQPSSLPRSPRQKRVHHAQSTASKSKPSPRPRVLTYYDIFQVQQSASVEVIAAAHRALVKKYHPDVAGPSGEAKIKMINAAWEVLRDPAKRKEYDRMAKQA